MDRPVEVKVSGPDERTLLYRGGETIEWQVVVRGSPRMCRFTPGGGKQRQA